MRHCEGYRGGLMGRKGGGMSEPQTTERDKSKGSDRLVDATTDI